MRTFENVRINYHESCIADARAGGAFAGRSAIFEGMPEGPPMAWLVAVLGLYVAVAPFMFGFSGTYQTSLIAAGLIVAVLAVWRGWQPDEKVPLPLLPLAVVILGLYTIAAPFLFGSGVGDLAGITLIISGLVFIVVPAMMVNKMINEKQKGQTA